MSGLLSSTEFGFGHLGDMDFDALELVVRIPLPWLMRLVGAVWRGHPVTFAKRGVWVGVNNVVSVSLKDMLDDIMVGMVVKHGSPCQSGDLDVMADA